MNDSAASVVGVVAYMKHQTFRHSGEKLRVLWVITLGTHLFLLQILILLDPAPREFC